MNDVMVYRLMAEMDKQWGMVEEGQPRAPKRASSATSDLNEVMVCQMRALIRRWWPNEFGVKPNLTLIQGGRPS